MKAADIVALARTPAKAADLGVEVRTADYAQPGSRHHTLAQRLVHGKLHRQCSERSGPRCLDRQCRAGTYCFCNARGRCGCGGRSPDYAGPCRQGVRTCRRSGLHPVGTGCRDLAANRERHSLRGSAGGRVLSTLIGRPTASLEAAVASAL